MWVLGGFNLRLKSEEYYLHHSSQKNEREKKKDKAIKLLRWFLSDFFVTYSIESVIQNKPNKHVFHHFQKCV